MSIDQRIYKFKGIVQHYQWGGYAFIPQLIDIENSENKTYAEYWLGAHPNHSATIHKNGKEVSLHGFINQNKIEVLGKTVSQQFNSLPYLFKVLDVRQMLSIQVHPKKSSAEEGFQKENAAGIPINAPHRNYKDDNHKPELMVALGDFWLLHGFKPKEKLKNILTTIPEFNFLLDVFNGDDYRALYEKVMLMEQKQVNEILHPVISKILPLYKNNDLKKVQEHFWAARAAESFCKDGNYDRGIFSIYFFNLVHLKKLQGIYQPAQLPHAYLEGQNVEVMANSDNVLRAGLTDKHIDVEELMKHVKFEETHPRMLGSENGKHKIYSSPAEEFEVEYYNLSPNEEVEYSNPSEGIEVAQITITTNDMDLESLSAEIIFVIKGKAKISDGFHELILQKGEAVLISAGTHYILSAQSGAELFRVMVPEKGDYT
jgi:mannose-6-phosphate isomerase